MAASPNAWRHQDGIVLVASQPDEKPRAQYYWDRRAPARWQGYNVRTAWREAEPVDARVGNEAVARLHEASGMVLVAKLGVLLHASRREYYSEIEHREENTPRSEDIAP